MDNRQYTLKGQWSIEHVVDIQKELDRQVWPDDGKLTLLSDDDFSLDLSGAWVIKQLVDMLQANHLNVDLMLADQGLVSYLKQLPEPSTEPQQTPGYHGVKQLADLGRWAVNRWKLLLSWLDFIGHLFVTFLVGITNIHHLRVKSISRHLYTSGVQAVPIVALIAFLISVVLAYQGAMQLTRFGADVYTIDLVALSVLREMGVLLTAIMVAGRSGSAFAAEIGVMKINQEVDAIRVMGMDPMEVLVLPRTIALVIAVPMLTFVADIMGVAGSALLSWVLLDIPLVQYLQRVHSLVASNLWIFWVGMIKAPVFALLIAAVGTMRGMQVETSAERVGALTTQAVVESIFLVILADALFSILFARLGI